MRKIIITLVTLTIFTQSCIDKKNENNIKLFESTLSIENTNTLNELVRDFDSYLLKKFPTDNSLDSSYKTFLTNACRPESILGQKSDSLFFLKLRNQFFNSDFNREIILSPDSLILINDNKSLVRIYYYYEAEEEPFEVMKDTFLLPPNPNNIDLTKIDLFKHLERHNHLKLFNVFGQFYSGLDKVKNNNDFIASYLDYKKQVLENKGHMRISGFGDFSSLACGLINDKVQLTDYFTKRIIIIEFLN